MYLSEVAKGAKDLGYDIAIGKHGNPELAHVNREQIEHFSRRSRAVTAALESEGFTRATATAARKRVAALATREAKKEYDHAALRAGWIERGRDVGLLAEVPARGRGLAVEVQSDAAAKAVEFAVEHLGEREAAFTRRDLLVQALRAGRGASSSRAVTEEVDRGIANGSLLQDAAGEWITTSAAVENEREILAIERRGREAVPAIAETVSGSDGAERNLNVGQRSAVELILSTRSRVVGVNGLAGTGKTTTLKLALKRAEQEGFQIVGLAPSHSAVRALKRAGIQSQTLQRWLMKRDAEPALSSRSVVILDEAGLTGTATLRALLERVERGGARAVLVGDIHQYQSVEAGRGFAQLQQHGMMTAELTEMIRQRNARLAEAARASVDAPARALELLPVVEEEDSATRHQRIARDFASLSSTARAETLILTGSHEARRAINERVRAELGLAGSGQRVQIFRAQDKSVAEKKQLETYRAGLTVRFEKDYRSLSAERGDTALVERGLSDAIVLRVADGMRRTMSPQKLSGKGWSVGSVESLEVAVGDRVRFTGTDRRAGYRNGEAGVIQEISHESIGIRRTDGRVLQIARARPIALDYSYGVTGHSAQGLDATRVILEKDTRSRTTNHRSFYTDLTRAREAALVVTDSAQRLVQRVRSDLPKSAALDIVRSTGRDAITLEREQG